jgi:hypothetical protein
LVPVEPKLEVVFKLALGVTLGGKVTVTVSEEFEDGTIDALALAGGVESVRGKGERGSSELVPMEPRLEVMFRLALGVTLGGTVVDEFEDCTIDALALAGGVESVREDGVRGPELSLVPVEPMDIGLVGTDDGALVDGVIIPLSPVADEVNVPPEIVMLPTPPVVEMTTIGVGTGFVGPLIVTFAEPGGMIPDAPMDDIVAVDPEVEKITKPDETVMFGGELGIELGGGISPNDPVEVSTAVDPEVEKISTPDETVTLGKTELGGGIAPDAPVDVVMAVDAPMEIISIPEEVNTVTFKAGVERGGGIKPSPPVEPAVCVLPPIVIFPPPTVTVSVKVKGPVEVGTGGIMPFPPSLIVVAVENDTINTVEPTDIVSIRPGKLEAGTSGTAPDAPVEVTV